MKFLDQAKIYIKSGDGGGGAVSFHRENSSSSAAPMAAMADAAAMSWRSVPMASTR